LGVGADGAEQESDGDECVLHGGFLEKDMVLMVKKVVGCPGRNSLVRNPTRKRFAALVSNGDGPVLVDERRLCLSG
ncbi:MAG: hypothetical protein ABI218_08460, partial [Caldimonas sp.]